METSEVNQLLDGKTRFAKEDNGLKTYYVLPQEETQDAERGFRVFCIGRPADRPTRCVLLLGETGAGKTTFINAVLNYLFGVRFQDPFRLQVREESEDGRMETESQTDFTTAYTVYYKEGMKHEYNFVFIDTPGFADTRGTQHQENTRCCLEALLMSNFGVDDLNCVGLVAKANANRVSESQKALLGEIISLLGNSVLEITHIFATFAVEKPSVGDVVNSAGITFQSMFQFDNGVFFTSNTCSQRHHAMLSFRWEVMNEQYDIFFNALINAPSVSIQILREKKHFDTCKKNLKAEIEELATAITAIEGDRKIYIKYELQEAKNEGWMKEETVEKRTSVNLQDGNHAHNCLVCNQTCIHPCCNSSGKGLVAGLAGGLGGTAAGGVVAGQTAGAIATTAAQAASAEGLVASVGRMVAHTLGGAITATEVGALAVAGTASSMIIGGVMGIAAGLAVEALRRKMVNSCPAEDVNDVCGRDGCPHPLRDHLKQEKIIKKESEVKRLDDRDMKELFEVAVSKKLEAGAEILSGQQKIFSRRKYISLSTVQLLYHAKRIQELTSQDCDYVEDVTCQLINEIRLGEPSVIPHALKHVNVLKDAMRQLVSCATEEVLGKHEFVNEMLLSIYKDQ